MPYTVPPLTKRWLLGVLMATAITVGACGGSDSERSVPTEGIPTLSQQTGGATDGHESGSGSTVDTPPSTSQVGIPTPASGTVVVATIAGRQILTTEDGFTLYVFANDPANAGTSSCFASCAQAWPPFVIIGTPSGAADVAGGLGSITRDDGGIQVSYKGRPLYRFANDATKGDTKGDKVGGVWSVAIP